MLNRYPVLLLLLILTGCSQKYYIVRHAEKAQAGEGITMQSPNNPPLSDKGKQRALDLRERLKAGNIGHIFSTNTLRTMQTAGPLADELGISIVNYGKADSSFIAQLLSVRKNTLVVGHSNTVDDLVNKLTGKVQMADLPDNAYDNLFLVRRKGRRLTLSKLKYGQPSGD